MSKMSRLRALAARGGSAAARGWKGSLAAAGGGAASALLDTYVLGGVSYFTQYPWLNALLTSVAGHFAKKKFPNVGAGVLGVGGYKLANFLLALTAGKVGFTNASGLTDPSEVISGQARGVEGMFSGAGDAEGMDAYARMNALPDASMAMDGGALVDAGAVYDVADAEGLYD